MKLRYLTAFFLLLSVGVFAQKKEVNQAEKAIEKGDFSTAEKLLKTAEPKVESLNDKFKAKYYNALGQLYFSAPSKEGNLQKAAENFDQAAKYGDKEEAEMAKSQVVQKMIDIAIQEQDNGKYKESSLNFYNAYNASPTDTIFLMAAANNAFNAEDDDTAIEYYNKLMNMGFKGNSITYTAVNKETGEVQAFDSKSNRDLFVKSGSFENPEEKVGERQDGNIIKQMAAIYLRQGKEDKALEFVNKALANNPNDVELIKSQAFIYNKVGDDKKYYETVEKLLSQDSENAHIYYSILGDDAVEKEEFEKAEGYYKKAIEANDQSIESYNGMANVYLTQQKKLVDQMQELGMSAADNKKYDELSKKRDHLLEEALPYLEKAYNIEPTNKYLLQTLYQLHSQLGNKAETQKFKSEYEAASAE